MKVFILAGQSNMVGHGNPSDLPEEYGKGPENVSIFRGGKWAPLVPEKRFGPEIGFGHEMAKLFSGERVGLIKVSRGGTSLGKDWAPDSTDAKALYPQLVRQVKAAKAVGPVEILGMLWMQGGRDARDKDLAEAYAENMKAFIARVRADLGVPDLPFVYGQSGVEKPPERYRYHYMPLVRKAQADTERIVPRTKMVNTEGLGFNADRIHYNAEGQIELGKRFAEAVRQMLQ